MSDPLRIAVVNAAVFSGADRCAADLAAGLAQEHEVLRLGVKHGDTPRDVFRQLDEFQPDAVHLHAFFTMLPYSFLAQASRRYRTLLTVHDPRPIGLMDVACWDCEYNATCYHCPLAKPFPRYSLIFNRYFRKRLKKKIVHSRIRAESFSLIAPCVWMKNRLSAVDTGRFRIDTVPYGIDTAHFRRIPDARRQLGIAENAKIILFVSNTGGTWKVNPRKGLSFLVQALQKIIAPAHPDVELRVIGEGLVPNHPNVRPQGQIAQELLPLYYSAADVFAAPSLADNLPYTVLEAMGCGTPVVGFDTGGMSEEIIEGITGHIVPKRDVEKLGARISELLANPEQARQFGLASRARIEAEYSQPRMIANHVAVYRDLLQLDS